MKMKLVCYPLYTDADGKEVIAFRFDPSPHVSSGSRVQA
jgi:hypothetical protein